MDVNTQCNQNNSNGNSNTGPWDICGSLNHTHWRDDLPKENMPKLT